METSTPAAATTEANGTTSVAATAEATTSDSTLKRIRENWKKKGEKIPTEAEREKLLTTWKKNSEAVTHAAKKLEDAKAAEDKAVLALAEAFGARSLRIDGNVHEFACRGTKVFFRKKNHSDVVDL